MSKITYVNLADLNLPSFQAHRDVPPDLLKDLSDSIKSIGVIEPLIIRKTDAGLEIVAGCLRYEASRLAGLKAVPCINMDLNSKAAEIIKLHENIKRIPLNHVDQGYTFIMMMEEFSMTMQTVADSIFRSLGYVAQHVNLAQLNNELTAAVKSEEISFSHARELMRIKDAPERNRLLNYCRNDGATITVLKRWVQDSLRDSSVVNPPDPLPEILRAATNQIDYSRMCNACSISVDISEIRTTYYCPSCDTAIKNAIAEERKQKPPDSNIYNSQEAAD